MIKISAIDASDIEPEILAFAPMECMNCHYDGGIPIQYFLVTPPIETEKDHSELSCIVKNQLGYENFSSSFSNMGEIISVMRCPQCGSEDIFMDF